MVFTIRSNIMNLFAKKSYTPVVLILGAGERAGKLYKEIETQKFRFQCTIRGFVPLEELNSVFPEDLILDSDETLAKLAGRLKVDEIVIVQDYPDQKCPVQHLLDCKMAGIQLSDLDSFLTRVRVDSASPEESYEPLLVNFN